MTKSTLSMGRINYINASPVYYGLDNGLLPDWIEMTDGAPSVLNGMIKEEKLEISPVSAAFYGMNHKELLVLPDLSISCDGRVMSVVLVSRYPLEQLDQKQVVLTSESATSTALVQLVFAEQGIAPHFTTTRLHCLEDLPEGTDAALVIGDAALTQPWGRLFEYRVDLGELWQQLTGLPFVFALWVVRRSHAQKNPRAVQQTLELFYRSRQQGYANIEKVIDTGAKKLNLDNGLVRTYYDLLFCDLDGKKVQALELYFAMLYKNGLFADKVAVEFFS
ncbi:MAG: menaquinone biosynthesis protein [Desulfobacteraceae bacterium]